MPLWKDIPLYLELTKVIRGALRVEKNMLKKKKHVFSFRERERATVAKKKKEKIMKTGMKNDKTNTINNL